MKWFILICVSAWLGFFSLHSFGATFDCGISSSLLIDGNTGPSTATIAGSTFDLSTDNLYIIPCTGSVVATVSGTAAISVLSYNAAGIDSSGYPLHDILIAGFIIISIGLGFLVGAKYV